MARVRKITCEDDHPRNYYLVDSCFLANKHIPPELAPTGRERDRVTACVDWWRQIEKQLDMGLARVFVPDICIAEAFKVLAKKYYTERWFPTAAAFSAAKKRLSVDVSTSNKALRSFKREVRFHDISTNRDIIVSVDRFFERFLKNGRHVQIADLVLVATAKYLMDFYDIPKDSLHIVTLDGALLAGIAQLTELPNAYDPTRRSHRAELVFEYA